MSVDTINDVDQTDDANQYMTDEDFSQEELYCNQVNAEHQLWELQRELSQAKLALQAEIWDLRAEVQTLRLNAIRAASDLDKIISRILTNNAPSPYDPNA